MLRDCAESVLRERALGLDLGLPDMDSGLSIFHEFYILIHITIHLFLLDIFFKNFAKNEFLYSIKNNSPYGIKKQKNTLYCLFY